MFKCVIIIVSFINVMCYFYDFILLFVCINMRQTNEYG